MNHKNESVDAVAKRHLLKITHYPFYSCKCGYECTILISDDNILEIVNETPAHVDYMDCGHAVCCMMHRDGKPWCSHCGEWVKQVG